MTVFRIEIDVRSTDVDADGIVNNAVYYQYQEEGRVKMLLGMSLLGEGHKSIDGDRFFTIAENGCRFLAPTRWPSRVVVETRVTEVRSRSFRLEYLIADAASGEVKSEGYSAQVWLDASGAAVPIPDGARKVLEEACEPSVAQRAW